MALDVETVIYCKLLEGKESQLEPGMQNMSIHTNTTSGYSGGLSLAYGNLTSPGLNYCLSFQSNFGSGGGGALWLLQPHQHQLHQDRGCKED